MKISEKFAEYGLTGGFFWLVQILFLSYSSKQNPTDLLNSLSTAVNQISIPQALSAATGSFLAAIAIISIFFTGLLLDLFGSFFILIEMRQFKKQINLNEQWFDDLVSNRGGYINSDYQYFKKSYYVPDKSDYKRKTLDVLNPFSIFKKESWKNSIEEGKKNFKNLMLMRSYTRILEFVQSFVLIHTNYNVLIYEIHLWRTSRSVSTALFISAFEFFYIFIINRDATYFPRIRNVIFPSLI